MVVSRTVCKPGVLAVERFNLSREKSVARVNKCIKTEEIKEILTQCWRLVCIRVLDRGGLCVK